MRSDSLSRPYHGSVEPTSLRMTNASTARAKERDRGGGRGVTELPVMQKAGRSYS